LGHLDHENKIFVEISGNLKLTVKNGNNVDQNVDQMGDSSGSLDHVRKEIAGQLFYLRDRWKKIHNSPQMVIEHIPKNENEKKRVVSYQMKQYLYTQDGYIRFSCSRNWLFQGYRKVWLNMVKMHGFNTELLKWNAMLKLKRMPGQIDFDGKVLMTQSERRETRRFHSKHKHNKI
jgi:hypothetical protein